MKKKIRTICIALIVGLFISNLGCTAMSLFMGERWTMNILYETNIMVVFMSVTAGLIFKERVSHLELWIRRGIVILLWCIADPLCLYLFGNFNHICGHTNYEFLLKTIGVTTPIMIIVLIICFMIGDRLEKKHLEIINKKLSENTEE